MDPNEALKNLREALRGWHANGNEWESADDPMSEQLVDAAEALDEWLSKGGFLPAAWQQNRS